MQFSSAQIKGGVFLLGSSTNSNVSFEKVESCVQQKVFIAANITWENQRLKSWMMPEFRKVILWLEINIYRYYLKDA
jgi:hypothetical protein